MIKNITKIFGVVGSTGGAVADIVEISGKSLKDGLGEVSDFLNEWKEENELDRAKERILARAKTIKELAEKLGVSEDEARRLLQEELNG